MPFVDLHCHSTASDGTLPPAEVVRLAKQCGLSALALTDHDTVDGIDEAAREAESLGLDFISGIEISAEYPHPGTMHILGYGVDTANPLLKNLTDTLIAGRDNRNPKIVAKLNEMGVSVSMAEWEDEAQGAVIGRPQLAAILMRKGYVSSIKQAFDKYIGQGAPAYFDKRPARACASNPASSRELRAARKRDQESARSGLGRRRSHSQRFRSAGGRFPHETGRPPQAAQDRRQRLSRSEQAGHTIGSREQAPDSAGVL
jgi:hypothetical protein